MKPAQRILAAGVPVVMGMLLLPALPYAIMLLMAYPDPMGHSRPPYPPIPTLAPSMVYIQLWQKPLRILFAAGISWLGVLIMIWSTLWRRWWIALAVSMISGLLLLCWAGYSVIDASIAYLTYQGGATINGQRYELFQAKYPSGPLYQMVYACDDNGWGCDEVTQAMTTPQAGTAEERIRNLLNPPQPLSQTREASPPR